MGRREGERGRNGRQEEAKLNKKRKTEGSMEGRDEGRKHRRADGRNEGNEGRTEGRTGRKKQPNIVFILVDDLGYNDVPWHNPDIEAGTLLKLARKGIVLESHYVLPLCTPSRAALLTGLYPFRIGMQVSSSPLSPTGLNTSLTLLPQKLKQLGYSTHLIGKWHLGYCNRKYTPTQRGFDSFYGFYLGSQTYYTRFKRLPDSLYKNNNSGEQEAGEQQNGGYDFRYNEAPLRNVSGIYSADLFASRAESIIANHAPSTPLFLLLSFQSVHSPLDVPQSFMRRDGRTENPARRTFHGMVRAMDGAVRRVVQQLKAYNLYHNTIIVFTTDNGGNIRSGGNNFPLRGTKGSVFEGGTRGPAFIHSPLLPRTGFKYKGLMHIVDWYETLLHVARFGTRTTNHHNPSNYMYEGNSVLQNNPAAPQNNVSQTMEEEEEGERRNEGNYSSGEGDGMNMWSAILENRESPRTTFVYNLRKKPLRGAIRRRHWKLILGSGGRYDGWVPPYDVGGLPDARCCSTWFTRSPTPPLMLFNIKDDPLETTDVAALYPDVVATLTSKLRAYSSTAIQPRIPPDDPNGHPSKHGGMFSPGWCTAIR